MEILKILRAAGIVTAVGGGAIGVASWISEQPRNSVSTDIRVENNPNDACSLVPRFEPMNSSTKINISANNGVEVKFVIGPGSNLRVENIADAGVSDVVRLGDDGVHMVLGEYGGNADVEGYRNRPAHRLHFLFGAYDKDGKLIGMYNSQCLFFGSSQEFSKKEGVIVPPDDVTPLGQYRGGSVNEGLEDCITFDSPDGSGRKIYQKVGSDGLPHTSATAEAVGCIELTRVPLISVPKSQEEKKTFVNEIVTPEVDGGKCPKAGTRIEKGTQVLNSKLEPYVVKRFSTYLGEDDQEQINGEWYCQAAGGLWVRR